MGWRLLIGNDTWGGKAGGADASRLHGLRGERSNVPRWGAGLYGEGGLHFDKFRNQNENENKNKWQMIRSSVLE